MCSLIPMQIGVGMDVHMQTVYTCTEPQDTVFCLCRHAFQLDIVLIALYLQCSFSIGSIPTGLPPILPMPVGDWSFAHLGFLVAANVQPTSFRILR